MAEPAAPTHFRNLSDTGQNISNGIISISHLICVNISGAAAFLQFFDRAAADVALGTTRPLFVIPVPSTTGVRSIALVPPMLINTRLSVFSTTTAEGLTGSGAGVFLQALVV